MVLDQKTQNEIRDRFRRLTSGVEAVSKREAWRRISTRLGISYGTARYHTDEGYRKAVLAAQDRANATGQYRDRKTQYASLRRSKLAREVLPRVCERADYHPLTLAALSDLVHEDTGIRFRERTLHGLLLDRYAGSPRGPPLEELADHPGSYRLSARFYDRDSTDQG